MKATDGAHETLGHGVWGGFGENQCCLRMGANTWLSGSPELEAVSIGKFVLLKTFSWLTKFPLTM